MTGLVDLIAESFWQSEEGVSVVAGFDFGAEFRA
jgi:hypothetical protein